MKRLLSHISAYLNKHGFGRKQIIAATIILLIGVVASILYCNVISSEDLPVSIRQNSPDFKYINPLLFIDNSKEDFSEYKSLERDLRQYIDEVKDAKKAKRVSVYFRDLNTSRWGGIDEHELYSPSSMLKVAILVSYLKIAERDPTILDKKVWHERSSRYEQYYKPKNELSEGNHTIRDLLKYMIVESDNSPMSTLIALQSSEILQIYKELRLPDPLASAENFMSAESYSYIFRTLYNSTYLRRTFSEEALRLLTHTNFDKGIVAGVSSTTQVAHKFGEYTEKQNGSVTKRQLHDCGIVYKEDSPYLLCVMTEGSDFADLEKIISDISHMVYKFIHIK